MTEHPGHTRTPRGWSAAAWASMPLSVLAALALIDWEGSGTPCPFVMLFLPALIGVAGGLAGARAGRPALGVCAGTIGIVAVPALFVVTLMLFGP